MRTQPLHRISIAAVLCLLAISARSQTFQRSLDTTSTTFGMITGFTSTTDSGCVMVLHTDSGYVQWKGDANGNALWCRKYSVRAARIARMPDGGVVFGVSSPKIRCVG